MVLALIIDTNTSRLGVINNQSYPMFLLNSMLEDHGMFEGYDPRDTSRNM